MATAVVDDVKDVINTNLADSDITNSIEYAQELNELYYDPSSQDTVVTKNIERWGAIVNIRQNKERSVEEDSVGDASAVYEGDELQWAKAQLSKWEPGNKLASSLITDSSRYTGTVTPNSS